MVINYIKRTTLSIIFVELTVGVYTHLMSSSIQIILSARFLSLAHEVSWQLHAHEHPGHEEAEENADKTDEEQQEAVEFGNVGCIGTVQDYKAQASHGEEKTGGQTFHNVLPVHSVRQKGHWPLVPVLVSH